LLAKETKLVQNGQTVHDARVFALEECKTNKNRLNVLAQDSRGWLLVLCFDLHIFLLLLFSVHLGRMIKGAFVTLPVDDDANPDLIFLKELFDQGLEVNAQMKQMKEYYAKQELEDAEQEEKADQDADMKEVDSWNKPNSSEPSSMPPDRGIIKKYLRIFTENGVKMIEVTWKGIVIS
jgi:hypothetical protein